MNERDKRKIEKLAPCLLQSVSLNPDWSCRIEFLQYMGSGQFTVVRVQLLEISRVLCHALGGRIKDVTWVAIENQNHMLRMSLGFDHSEEASIIIECKRIEFFE